jgi:hypothetical protein
MLGCEPQLTWKFSDGRGSKDWVVLQDEEAYKCMMKLGADRIRARAKKETNLEDPALGFGWRIDIRPATKALRVEEGGENDDDTEIVVKEKGKRKAASKRVPAKRKHYGRKKVLPSY